MEQWRREQEEQRRLREEQQAREAAEREEKTRRALDAAQVWWRRVSQAQRVELFAAVAERAWKEEQLRIEIPEEPKMRASFAYGVPLFSRDRFHSLYGIVRPCPGLVSLSPQLDSQRILVRNAQEARELQAAMAGGARITHFDLPDHEQLPLC